MSSIFYHVNYRLSSPVSRIGDITLVYGLMVYPHKFLTNVIKTAYGLYGYTTPSSSISDCIHSDPIRAQSLCPCPRTERTCLFFSFFSQSLYLFPHCVRRLTITRRVKKGHVGFIVFLSHAYYIVSLCVLRYNSVHCAHTRYNMFTVG